MRSDCRMNQYFFEKFKEYVFLVMIVFGWYFFAMHPMNFIASFSENEAIFFLYLPHALSNYNTFKNHEQFTHAD